MIPNSSNIPDRTPIQTTKRQSERGGHPTRNQNPAHKHQQTSQRGIHHNFPPRRGRRNNPQTRNGDNSNNCTAYSPRVQNQTGKLWTISVDKPTTTERAHHAYNLPSVGQTIRYLRGAAGFPAEDTWIKAIKAGNYNTWPHNHTRDSLTPLSRIR